MTKESDKKEEGSACGCGGGSCSSGRGKWIWIILALAVVGVLIAKNAEIKQGAENTPPASLTPSAVKTGDTHAVALEATTQGKPMPRMVDLGAGKCIPCKMMAPILEDLKKTYVGKLDIQFIDVWENPDAGKKYGIAIIPTQIFYDAQGKELFRHEGFFSKDDILTKWKEFGVDLTGAAALPGVSRWTPAQPDTRDKDTVCYMCDGDIPSNSRVVVKTEKGDVRLCGMHHYFVMYSCLTEDKDGFEKKVSITDWATGSLVPISDAVYVYGMEAKTGRPTVKAFTDKGTAEKEQQASGGNVLALAVLQSKELANKCGFCDRSVYPEDVAVVTVGDVKTWGCCSHCALGVAARTGKDIEIRERDRLTGERVVVKTFNGCVASLEPATAVAWFGQRTKSDGTHTSAGCFHQGFFANAENLKKWVDANPLETGEMIPIQKALADKMHLTPQQISKACKIGECAPK